ncbi:MAG: hypothetical protein WBK55_00690 [Alphaproteobacteria bacterium]
MSELKIDRETMGKLAGALAFITKPDHPTVLALRKAAESGTEKDIKDARAAFLRLKSSERQGALGMLSD